MRTTDIELVPMLTKEEKEGDSRTQQLKEIPFARSFH